jgi:hypothetical protein
VASRRERQVAEWEAALAEHGRVEFRTGRRAWRRGLLALAVFLATGVVLLLTGDWVAGGVSLAMVAVFGGLMLVGRVRNKPLLVVEAEGFRRLSPRPEVWGPWRNVVDARPMMGLPFQESINIASITDWGVYEHTRLAPGVDADPAALMMWIATLAQRAKGSV